MRIRLHVQYILVILHPILGYSPTEKRNKHLNFLYHEKIILLTSGDVAFISNEC